MHSPHMQLHCGLENDLEKTLAAEIMVIGYCDKTTDGKECNLQCCLDLILIWGTFTAKDTFLTICDVPAFVCLKCLFVCLLSQRSNEIGVETISVEEQSVSRGSTPSKQVSAPAGPQPHTLELLHSAGQESHSGQRFHLLCFQNLPCSTYCSTTAPSTGHHSHSARCLHLPNSAVLLLLNSILKSFHFPEKYKWSRWQVD